jgi:hypothetical protein
VAARLLKAHMLLTLDPFCLQTTGIHQSNGKSTENKWGISTSSSYSGMHPIRLGHLMKLCLENLLQSSNPPIVRLKTV